MLPVSHIVPQGQIQWYPPVMIGAETIKSYLFSGNYIDEARRLLSFLSSDEYSIFLSNFYADGINRFGRNWHYADIVTVLICLSRYLKPKSYLEIGVRRGRSAAAVASVCPNCNFTLLDMWEKDYAGISNPGSIFVHSELDRLNHLGERVFIDGDSHVTLPRLFEEQPTLDFDLITVDGDHSDEGARLDLSTVLPRLKIGGAVVFDDISHPTHPNLDSLWNELVASNSQFSSFSFRDAGYGVGFAIRKF